MAAYPSLTGIFNPYISWGEHTINFSSVNMKIKAVSFRVEISGNRRRKYFFFRLSVNMGYFKMSKVAWQMTLTPHSPRWLALTFWPTGDVFTHASNQGTPHHRSETGLSDRKIHKQRVTYPQTPQEHTHCRSSSSKDSEQHTDGVRELHFFFLLN